MVCARYGLHAFDTAPSSAHTSTHPGARRARPSLVEVTQNAESRSVRISLVTPPRLSTHTTSRDSVVGRVRSTANRIAGVGL